MVASGLGTNSCCSICARTKRSISPPHPVLLPGLGNLAGDWFLVGPMFLPLGAFANPRFENLDVGRVERGAVSGGRHALFRIGGGDASEKLGLVGLARHDDPFARLGKSEGGFLVNEAYPPRVFHAAMAGSAMLGEDRPNVGVEGDLGRNISVDFRLRLGAATEAPGDQCGRNGSDEAETQTSGGRLR